MSENRSLTDAGIVPSLVVLYMLTWVVNPLNIISHATRISLIVSFNPLLNRVSEEAESTSVSFTEASRGPSTSCEASHNKLC